MHAAAGNRTTRRQTNSRSVKSRTGQLAEMFDLKIGIYNSFKCYFGQITLFIRCQYSVGLELGLGLSLMCKYSTVIPWFLKIRCRRVGQSASYPACDLTDRELVCRLVVLLPCSTQNAPSKYDDNINCLRDNKGCHMSESSAFEGHRAAEVLQFPLLWLGYCRSGCHRFAVTVLSRQSRMWTPRAPAN